MTEEKKRELLEEGLKHLGTPVTQELKRFAESQLRGYLWRGKKEKRHIRRYMCSLCGAEFESDDRYPDDIYNEFEIKEGLKHNERISCPKCERELWVYDAWRPVNTLVPMFVEQWRKSNEDPNKLVAVGARVWTRYDEAWTLAAPEISVSSFAVMTYGRKGQRYITDGLGYRAAYDMADLSNGFVGSRWVLDDDSVNEAVQGTPFERICSDGIIASMLMNGGSPLMKISRLARCPQAEYMVKLGFTAMVKEMLSSPYYTAHSINWQGRNAEEVFGTDMATIRALRAYGNDLTDGDYRAFLKLSRAVPGWPVSLRMEMLDALGIRYRIDDITEECKVRQYRVADELKYLRRQKAHARHIGWHDLHDFWAQCDQLGVAGSDYRTRHPKDLHEAHAEFSRRIKYLENKANDDAIEYIAGEYDQIYGFSCGGMTIRCAKSSREVIDEGTALHHCVGGYVKKYASGDTLIMVLRRDEEPDKPWHTVELTPEGRMVQCRGDHNQTAKEDKPLIELFWGAWKEEMERRRRMRAKTA